MLRRFSVNMAIFSMLADIVLTYVAFFAAVWLRPYLTGLTFPTLIPHYAIDIPIWFYIVMPVLWLTIFLLNSVYDPKRLYKAVDEFQTVTIAVGIASLVMAGLLFLAFRELSRWLFVSFLVFDLALLLGWRILSRFIFRIGRLPAQERSVLIIGAGHVGRRVGQMIQNYHWMGLNLVGYLDDDPQKLDGVLPVLGCLEEARRIIERQKIDDVVIALPQKAYGQINKLALTLHDMPVHVRVVPDYFSLALYRATVDDFGGLPMINLRDPALNDVQRLVKRLFDLAVGGILFALAVPFLLLIALLVRLDSTGPIILRQQRVGENGHLFNMYKFRSMVNGAERLQAQVNEINDKGQLIHKKANDPRVTHIGRFLRRTSLDELPQLLNVLKGDMSLVGPRPELPWLLDQYQLWQHKRLAVPQGMTGWWQINSRAEKLMHLYTEDDIYYIQNYSLWLDIYILLKTPWVVVRGKGAY
jgi:exopolysaccharide biosynthesis polyprenyl glycosylphosphotransferase